MTYSYTQISQYLACPRRYKHRYLEGWKEKDSRAAEYWIFNSGPGRDIRSFKAGWADLHDE